MLNAQSGAEALVPVSYRDFRDACCFRDVLLSLVLALQGAGHVECGCREPHRVLPGRDSCLLRPPQDFKRSPLRLLGEPARDAILETHFVGSTTGILMSISLRRS